MKPQTVWKMDREQLENRYLDLVHKAHLLVAIAFTIGAFAGGGFVYTLVYLVP